MWVLLNHFRDEEDEWEKQKLLLRFMNPQAASILFDKKDVDTTVSTEEFLFDQMAKDLKGKYSSEELAAIMKDPSHYSSLDKIEKA